MPNLVTTSKRFLEWAQSLPYVVIPAGLESDMQEAIAKEEAAEQSVQLDSACSHPFATYSDNIKTCVGCGAVLPQSR